MELRRAYDPFRALRGAWALVRSAPAAMLVGGLVLVLLDPGSGWAGFSWEEDLDLPAEAAPIVGLIVCLACLLGLGLWIFRCLVAAGMGTAVERAAVAGEDRPGDLFRSEGRLLSMVVTQLLQFLAVALVAGLGVGATALAALLGHTVAGEPGAAFLGVVVGLSAALGVVYVGLGVALASTAVAFERLSPLDALERAWSLARGSRVRLAWFWIVLLVVTLLGLCACIVGVFATATWATLAEYEAYLRLVRPDQEGWAVDRPRPGPATPSGV